MNKKFALCLVIIIVLLCFSGCDSIATQPLKTAPVSPAVPTTTVSPITTPRKAAVDTSLIEKVHWEEVYSYPDEEWYDREYIFSNGKYSFFLTFGYKKGIYMLNIAGNKPMNDICPLTIGKSMPPEYYSLISTMEGDHIELRFYPSEQKLRIIDGGHRYDDNNYSGDYERVIQKISKYPKGAIIFTRLDNVGFQSVVMIPYVDGSADFVVNEKDTYHCGSYTENEHKERVYQYKENNKEYVFTFSISNADSETYVQITGKSTSLYQSGYYYADSTKY